jgi:hypothetical protein
VVVVDDDDDDDDDDGDKTMLSNVLSRQHGPRQNKQLRSRFQVQSAAVMVLTKQLRKRDNHSARGFR